MDASMAMLNDINQGLNMKPCRECKHTISEQALACPQCGAPFPAKVQWNGWGFEYKSQVSIGILPLVHIAFKYKPNRFPVVAKGVIAIGQFAVGVFTISQFGVGVISISQMTVAVFALAQIAIAYSLIAQFGLYIHEGHGLFVKDIFELFKQLLSI